MTLWHDDRYLGVVLGIFSDEKTVESRVRERFALPENRFVRYRLSLEQRSRLNDNTTKDWTMSMNAKAPRSALRRQRRRLRITTTQRVQST